MLCQSRIESRLRIVSVLKIIVCALVLLLVFRHRKSKFKIILCALSFIKTGLILFVAL